MPDIDFTQIDDVQDFTPIPDGTYGCRVTEVEESATRRGDEMWKLRLEVLKGEYAGQTVFDYMIFSEAAKERVKHICANLGLDVSKKLSLTPSMIQGRTCRVKVVTEDYEDEQGDTKTGNKVPYAGYEPLKDEERDGEEERSPKSTKPMPF